MTHTTTFYVREPVHAERLLDVATIALGGNPATVDRDGNTDDNGIASIYNVPSQGLDALCWLYYCAERTMPTERDDPDRVYAMLRVDTPYSAPNGGLDVHDRVREALSVAYPELDVVWSLDTSWTRDEPWHTMAEPIAA